MKAKRKWIQEAIRDKGSFTAYCKRLGFKGVSQACIEKGKRSKDKRTKRRAVLAETLRRLRRKRKKGGR